MATSFRGKSGSRTGSAKGGTSVWGSVIGSSGRKIRKGAVNCPPGYKNVCNSFQDKIESYKALINQTQGPAKFGRPTPTTLNSFANWINKGAIIQTCTSAQVNRWARTTNMKCNTTTPSVTTCKNILGRKFGKNTIKAVARTKNGAYMVVTSPTANGRPFCFPKY